jgi:hypothetical protein
MSPQTFRKNRAKKQFRHKKVCFLKKLGIWGFKTTVYTNNGASLYTTFFATITRNVIVGL